MRPLCTALVWLAAAAHFTFLAYLPCGGFLALRRRRSIRVHAAVVAWAAASVAFGLGCPLTTAEQWARRRAGLAPLEPAGFIDHYLTGVVYPDGAEGVVRAAVFGAVAVSWMLFAATASGRSSPAVPG